MFTYTEEKIFTKERVQQLFLSVHWTSGNYPFYVNHGFSVMENGAAIQICNYGNMQ